MASKNGSSQAQEAAALAKQWKTDPRWRGVQRDYSAEDVIKLRPSVQVEATLARRGAERLWDILNTQPYVHTFGAITGAQAVQMVKAGLQAIYLSGWQVAADGNLSGNTYPDQSLYPSNSVPAVVKRLNNALVRADQLHRIEGMTDIDWYAPIVGRRGGWLWWPPARLRAHEVDDRRRRRGGSL